MHLHLATPDTPDTYDAAEDAALRAVVAATHLGGPLLPTVQSAVVHARMVHNQNWSAEAFALLEEFGGAPAQHPLLRRA
jgi:hypothetical protein